MGEDGCLGFNARLVNDGDEEGVAIGLVCWRKWKGR